MYPLLLHALKNFTNLKWTLDPKGIKEVRTRLTAFKGLLAELSSDCNLGGWSVEATCKGFHNPLLWVRHLVDFFDAGTSFDATVKYKKIRRREYVANIRQHIDELEAMIAGRHDRHLAAESPILTKCALLKEVFGFQMHGIELREIDDEAEPAMEQAEEEDLEDDEVVEPEPQSEERLPPEQDEDEVPHEMWSHTQRFVWANTQPTRILYTRFGRGAAAWWVGNRRGYYAGKAKTFQAACQLYIDLHID